MVADWSDPASDRMMAYIDKDGNAIIDLIKKIDWAKVVNYGSVKVQIRQGKATKITIEETVMLSD